MFEGLFYSEIGDADIKGLHLQILLGLDDGHRLGGPEEKKRGHLCRGEARVGEIFY